MVMTLCQQVPSGTPFILLLLFSFTPQLTAAGPLVGEGHSSNHGPSPPELNHSIPSGPAENHMTSQNEESLPQALSEDEDELFKDVDPKTLAAVLLEALNQPAGEKKNKRLEGEEQMAKARREEKWEGERAVLGTDKDRDRDGRQELELMMAAVAAQGNSEQHKEEEAEQFTENVKSRTSSHTMPVKVQPEGLAGKQPQAKEKELQEPRADEEQLSLQEVKNLQTMLEELQSYSMKRESRGYYRGPDPGQGLMENEIKPKGHQLALSKKKLKWQQELKKTNPPQYKGGNFMDDFDDRINTENEEDGKLEEELLSPDEARVKADQEEVLSPEEEEARAKEEQEEVRRQAAEAQRAKVEEEKLADIASDMLLQYIVKQGGKKYPDQSKTVLLENNAAEDKRSDEEDDDDIDPQTIDKLIEISSKLHLPADDVVDIISDVEKKKKKDVPENIPWHRPLVPPPAPAPAFLNPPSKPPLTRPSKTWFKDKVLAKPNRQSFWAKPQKSLRTYPSYQFYQKPYRGYFPIYFPAPKPKPLYYAKPVFSFSDLHGNSNMEYGFDFSPQQRYRPWAKLRSPNQSIPPRNLYFSNYILSHPRTFKPVPMPKLRSPPRRQPSYYRPAAPMVTRDEDYLDQVGQQQDSNEELENFIEEVFLKLPRVFK